MIKKQDYIFANGCTRRIYERHHYNFNIASYSNPWNNYNFSKAKIGFAVFTIGEIKNEKKFI